jgi:hypothetical protein|tara:strand:+ start:36 stop:500 length:465 start_codon:yes stop_codon:yes gene_type:complete
MQGLKHLIECHCILPQFRGRKEPIFHKFVVFSVIDEEDQILTKFSQCNNCGVVHKIIDICRSEIISGMEDSGSIISKSDIKHSLSKNLISILETYKCDIATWENVQFIIENEMWGSEVTIEREEIEDNVQVKFLKLLSDSKVKIETIVSKNEIS